jgi:hypothetical protein
VLERRAEDAVNRRDELRVVQPFFRLSLELRLLNEHAQDAGQPFSDVFRDHRDALRREVVRLDVVPHRLAEARAQSALVRPAGAGRNPVDVGPQVLVGRFRPLQDDVEPQPVGLVERKRQLVHRFRAALGDDLLQVVGDALVVLEDRFGARRFVLEGDLETLVQVARHLEPLCDDLGVELDLREDGGVRVEVDLRAGAARAAQLLQRADGMSLLEAHFPLRAVALDRRHELLRQRVDDARADAVEAARGLVAAVLELAARVEHGEDHLQRALLRARVLVYRDASTVVLDRHRRSVGVQRDPDVRREAVHRLVHAVVENLPDQVVEADRSHAADVHAGTFPDRIETLENGDVFGGVVA